MQFDSLQGFFESTFGQVITIAVIIVLFILILISGKKGKKTDVKGLVLSAIFVALYLVLNQITLFRMPQGGSITALSMLAISLCGFTLGTRRGVMAGLCAGLLSMIFNPYIIHPIQMLLDYPLAVGALAFGGFLRNKKGGLLTSYIFGVICRYICAFVSGTVFFGAYAPEGFNAVTWSLWYNLLYIDIEAAISIAVLCIPPVRNAFYRIKRSTGTL